MNYYETEINEYIHQKEVNGAILLSGKWGCGKTYIANSIINQINENDNDYIAIIVSLFGVNDIEQIDKKVKENVFNKIFRDKLNGIESVKNRIKPLFNTIKDIHPAFSGINTALSINIYDLINVEKVIKIPGKEAQLKEIVIFFDDIERTGIEIKDMLGKINEYSEGKKIKCILIADEDKIIQTEYSEFKEKLISRTVKINIDSCNIVETIVDSYNSDCESYKIFLKESKHQITDIFENSNSSNIRTLKTIFIDFERIYKLSNTINLPNNSIKELLCYFSILKFEYSLGNVNRDENYGYIHSNSKLKNKYLFFEKSNIEINSIQRWVYEGEWNKDNVISELCQKYGMHNISSEESFLYRYFWDLNQSIIDSAFPILLNKAYTGELSCSEYIKFLERIADLENLGIELKKIDYSKINSALIKKENDIKLGIIKDTFSQSFIHNAKERLSTESNEIYNTLEKLNERIPYYENRNYILEQFKNNEIINEYGIKGRAIVSFDKELMNEFFDKYIGSSNGQKVEIIRLLIKMNFNYSDISGEKEIKETITNLNIMVEKLKEYYAKETDLFSKAITNNTVDELTNLCERLSKKL